MVIWMGKKGMRKGGKKADVCWGSPASCAEEKTTCMGQRWETKGHTQPHW